jgi:hypothetical protein
MKYCVVCGDLPNGRHRPPCERADRAPRQRNVVQVPDSHPTEPSVVVQPIPEPIPERPVVEEPLHPLCDLIGERVRTHEVATGMALPLHRKNISKYFVPHFGSKGVEEITANDVDRFRQLLSASNVPKDIITTAYEQLKEAFEVSVRQHWIESMPLDSLDPGWQELLGPERTPSPDPSPAPADVRFESPGSILGSSDGIETDTTVVADGEGVSWTKHLARNHVQWNEVRCLERLYNEVRVSWLEYEPIHARHPIGTIHLRIDVRPDDLEEIARGALRAEGWTETTRGCCWRYGKE